MTRDIDETREVAKKKKGVSKASEKESKKGKNEADKRRERRSSQILSPRRKLSMDRLERRELVVRVP